MTLRRIRPLAFPAMLAVLCGASPPQAGAQEIQVSQQRIFVRTSSSAAWRALRTVGPVSTAALSPDRRWIAFVRETPNDTVVTGLGEAPADELWIVGRDGHGARRLLHGRAAKDMRYVLCAFRNLVWSPDGRTVYFNTQAWATSSAVHAVVIGTGAERYVAPGGLGGVIPSGKLAGDLLVGQHRYFLLGGSYDWLWVLTPEGKDVAPIGDVSISDDSVIARILTLFPAHRRGAGDSAR